MSVSLSIFSWASFLWEEPLLSPLRAAGCLPVFWGPSKDRTSIFPRLVYSLVLNSSVFITARQTNWLAVIDVHTWASGFNLSREKTFHFLLLFGGRHHHLDLQGQESRSGALNAHHIASRPLLFQCLLHPSLTVLWSMRSSVASSSLVFAGSPPCRHTHTQISIFSFSGSITTYPFTF